MKFGLVGIKVWLNLKQRYKPYYYTFSYSYNLPQIYHDYVTRRHTRDMILTIPRKKNELHHTKQKIKASS